MKRMSFNSESGVILPMVVIFIIALTIVGLALLNAAVLENKLAIREVRKNQAFFLADGGIEHLWVKLSLLGGHEEIRDLPVVGGGSDGDYQPAVGGTTVSRLALAEGGYWVEYYEGAAPYAISIGQVIKGGSISTVPGLGEVIVGGETIAQRKIQIMLLETVLFDYLIFGDEWVEVGGDSLIDHLGGDKGKVGTNGDDYGDLAATGSAQVIADIYIVDIADNIIDGIDRIHGNIKVGPPIVWPAVPEPGELTFDPIPLNIGSSDDDISLSGGWEYPSIDVKGTLIILENESCTLMADTVEISAGGEIIIETGASLKIYVKEEARLGGYGIWNVGENPLDCQVYGIGESTIRYEGTSDFYGVLYGPDGDIRCRGTAKIEGSMIGDTVDVSGNPLVQWNPDLATGGPTKTSLTNWQEIF